MTTPDYCTQNGGNCPSCALVSYGRDCQNKPLKGRFYTLGELAKEIAGNNITAMAKLLNDVGAAPRLDELDPSPGATVARVFLIDLAAMRAGDIVGRRAAQVLAVTMT